MSVLAPCHTVIQMGTLPTKPNAHDKLELQIDIATFLSEGPLYKPFEYEGDIFIPRSNGSFDYLFPRMIRLYCEHPVCSVLQMWRMTNGPYEIAFNGAFHCSFRCKNCEQSELTIYLKL